MSIYSYVWDSELNKIKVDPDHEQIEIQIPDWDYEDSDLPPVFEKIIINLS